MKYLVLLLALTGCVTGQHYNCENCPGPVGSHCGCDADYCRIPCSTCCKTVPCPIEQPTSE